jgi:acyl carrier protein
MIRIDRMTEDGTTDATIEETLTAIYRDLLRVPATETDDFFELGGDSILAYELIRRIASTFDVEIPLQALYSHSVPRALADQVRLLLPPGASGLRPRV